MRYVTLVLVIFGTLFVRDGRAANQCAQIFPRLAMTSETKNSVSHSISALAQLKIALDLAQAQGVSSVEHSVLSTDYKNKEQELAQYLEENRFMSRPELVARLKSEISEIQLADKLASNQREQEKEIESRERKKQQAQINDFIIDGKEAVFHRIEAGSFRMGSDSDGKVRTILTRPYQMMATPVTERVYHSVVNLAKQRFGARWEFEPSLKLGDTHPVSWISYTHAILWLEALNALSLAQDPGLKNIIRNHKDGDIYRLPTEAEWEFVVRGRGQFNDVYPYGKDPALLGEYAWFFETTMGLLQPVAQLKPIIVDGNHFYDLLGNIDEWVQDRFLEKLPGGVNPMAKSVTPDVKYVRRGGSSGTNMKKISSSYRTPGRPNDVSPDTGFRLVREVRP